MCTPLDAATCSCIHAYDYSHNSHNSSVLYSRTCGVLGVQELSSALTALIHPTDNCSHAYAEDTQETFPHSHLARVTNWQYWSIIFRICLWILLRRALYFNSARLCPTVLVHDSTYKFTVAFEWMETVWCFWNTQHKYVQVQASKSGILCTVFCVWVACTNAKSCVDR